MLTTRQFENGIVLAARLDVAKLFQTMAKLEAMGGEPKPEAGAEDGVPAIPAPEPGAESETLGVLVGGMISLLSGFGDGKSLRRLAAVMNATDAELKAAETNSKVLDTLLEKEATRPWMDSLKDATRFFTGLGFSQLASPSSFGLGEAEDPAGAALLPLSGTPTPSDG